MKNKVYLVYTATGEYEDYWETIEVIFDSMEKAVAYLLNEGYEETHGYNGKKYYKLEVPFYESEPKREDFDDEESYLDCLEDWEEYKDYPIYTDNYTAWIDAREVF